MGENEDRGFITNAQLQLEIKALRSDVRLWILGAVALNQFLASVDLPTSVTGAAILGFALKGLVFGAFRGGG